MPKTVKVNGISVNASTGRPVGRPPKKGTPQYKIYLDIKTQWEKKQLYNTGIQGSAAAELADYEEHTDLSDEDILTISAERYELMRKFVKMACEGAVRALIVSGKGGIGKTYTIEEITQEYIDSNSVTVEYISGMVTPITLYGMLYNNRLPSQIVVMDDADAVFFNEDSVGILKSAMDSKKKRKIGWSSTSSYLKDNGIPNKFEYEGSLIFLSNIDFQRQIDTKPNHKITPHLEALMTRPVYLDLKLHSPREVGLWIEYMIDTYDILMKEAGLSKQQQDQILEFIVEHRENMRSLSIRSALKIATFMQMDMITGKNEWEKTARELELRTVVKF